MTTKSSRVRKRAPLSRSLMLTFALFTVLVSALFGFFAAAFVYTVEDKFLEAMLREEAKHQQTYFATHGRWPAPQRSSVVLHTAIETMPREVREALLIEPRRREFEGEAGRHYHLLSFPVPPQSGSVENNARAWLLAEVSGELVVRPRREAMFKWFAGWGIAATLVSLVLAYWLARRVSAPIERLATHVASASPERLSVSFSANTRGSNEVVQLAQAFDALAERTRAFIDREQRFTRDASHELRTPLSVLRMSVERLQADSDTPHQVAATLATMHASLLSMEQTVECLLILARENESDLRKTETLALPAIEAWIVANEHWLTLRGATIQIDVAADKKLRLSGAALHLVVANLLSNAVTHGRDGALITVTAEDDSLIVENQVETDAAAGGGSSDSTRPGHGLGIAIVRRTLERYGYALLLMREGSVFRARVNSITAA